ncbi:Uncharacterised protein [Vibrio vulnificus]|nr:Uncharacterised protein [Vibrio vulnificus]
MLFGGYQKHRTEKQFEWLQTITNLLGNKRHKPIGQVVHLV